MTDSGLRALLRDAMRPLATPPTRRLFYEYELIAWIKVLDPFQSHPIERE